MSSGTKRMKAGDLVRARYNFTGTARDDLPFNKGDLLTIVEPTKDVNWYKARNSADHVGMVPANYIVEYKSEVDVHAMEWFHGKIPRDEAESLLQPRENGLFLVRDSTNFPRDYSVSVCFEGTVQHYHVTYTPQHTLTIDGESFFRSLSELVEHYKKDADGLVTRLQQPVRKLGPLEFDVDIRQFQRHGWVIRSRDIVYEDPIGKGEFADVYLCVYNGKKVAVKKLKDSHIKEWKFMAEAKLQHKNLVQLQGVVIDNGVQIVMEYMSKGSMVDYLRSRGRSVIREPDLLKFASDTCAAMEYLESKNFVHRDLAARNVLISEQGDAKVSDFGLALHENYSLESGKVPIKWTAPEALSDAKYTNKSDVWSFGIFLWELYSFGRVPYPRVPVEDVRQHVEHGYRMEDPDGCPANISSLMRSMANRLYVPGLHKTITAVIAKKSALKRLSLVGVKSVRGAWDPWLGGESTRSVQEVFSALHSNRVQKTNPGVPLRAQIQSDRTDPQLEVTYIDGSRALFKTRYLGVVTLAERFTQLSLDKAPAKADESAGDQIPPKKRSGLPRYQRRKLRFRDESWAF